MKVLGNPVRKVKNSDCIRGSVSVKEILGREEGPTGGIVMDDDPPFFAHHVCRSVKRIEPP
ncbi:MAG: hypothetical protein H0V62_11805 [Gammaproteobacteria bacterium]|nr:hypothetical protein [Gammaproteobacteria bacterium]